MRKAVDEATGRQALAFAVCHVNASLREPVTVDTVLAALQAGEVPSLMTAHMRVFFDETDLETLSDLGRSGLVTYGQLMRVGRTFLEDGHPTLEWLNERAAFEMA